MDEEAEAFHLGARAMNAAFIVLELLNDQRGRVTADEEAAVATMYMAVCNGNPLAMASGLHQGIEELGAFLHDAGVAQSGNEGFRIEMLSVPLLTDEQKADPLIEAAVREEHRIVKTVLAMVQDEANGNHDGVHERLDEVTKGVMGIDAARQVLEKMTAALFHLEHRFHNGETEPITEEAVSKVLADELAHELGVE
jgi:hypothetical protein